MIIKGKKLVEGKDEREGREGEKGKRGEERREGKEREGPTNQPPVPLPHQPTHPPFSSLSLLFFSFLLLPLSFPLPQHF